MHKGSKGTDLHALLSASHETGVILHCFGKTTRRETATRQVKLEARRGRIQLRGGTLCRGPAAGLATEFAPTPWQGRWAGAGETSRQELAAVPLAWAWRSAPGTFEGGVPQTQLSRWRYRPYSRVPLCATRGEIMPNKGSGGAQFSRCQQSLVSLLLSPSPEPRARASVCKQTGHVAAAARPWSPRNPKEAPAGPRQHHSS